MRKIGLLVLLLTSVTLSVAMEGKIEQARARNPKDFDSLIAREKWSLLEKRYQVTKQEVEAWKAGVTPPKKNGNGNGKKNGNGNGEIAPGDLKPIQTAAAAVGGALKGDPAAQAKKKQILEAVEQGLDAGM